MIKWSKGACEFCGSGNSEAGGVDVHPVEQTGMAREPADMCRVCYELGAFYVKDSMEPLRFDQFARGVRMILDAAAIRARG